MFKLTNTILLGIAIGILIAPDKGSKTREKLSGMFSGYIDDLGTFLSEKVDTVNSKLDSVEQMLETN
ncbi:MAG: YtxH domain-containing protein [Ferruginibacter sp.]